MACFIKFSKSWQLSYIGCIFEIAKMDKEAHKSLNLRKFAFTARRREENNKAA